MKERQILFSAPMVRAILDGRKTQTRRVVKPQPDMSILKESARNLEFEFRRMPILGPTHTPAEWGFVPKHSKPGCVPIYGYKCPFGKPCSKLWVRETWCNPLYQKTSHTHPSRQRDVLYAADDGKEFLPLGGNWTQKNSDFKWKQSIFMPRWASRITLEITDIRVQRVRDITGEDVVAEGISIPGPTYSNPDTNCPDPWDVFADIWDSINGKTYPWESNPWVWAISFKRIKP